MLTPFEHSNYVAKYYNIPKKLEIWTTCGAVDNFDPKVTFPAQYDGRVYWEMSDGTIKTVTSGVDIAHTFQAPGPHRAVLKGVPLDQITEIDINTDLINEIKNLKKMTRCTSVKGYTNAGLVMSLSDLPVESTYADFTFCALLTGDLSDLPVKCTTAIFTFCALLTGNLSDLPARLRYVYLQGCPLLVGDSIAQLTAISVIRIYNNGWNAAMVDAVIDSIYQAVVADPNHFSNAAPKLEIQANNAAPTGVYQFAAEPSTGLEKVYYLSHLGSHAWTITYNGGVAP